MAYVWTTNLSVGVSKIDEQHKMIFQKANELFNACQQQKGFREIDKLLKFLDEYVIMHFREEEIFMKKINYPGLDIQKSEHSVFIDKVASIRKEYQTSSENILIVLNAIRMISDWLTNHISKEDKKIGEFFNKK